MGLFSKKKPPVPDNIPTGPWAMVQGSNQGKLLLARVHKGLGAIVGHAAYPFRVGVATRVRATAANGMPTPEENATLQEVEDRLQLALEAEREAILVVALTTNGVKEWVLYTSDVEATKRRMESFGPTVKTHQLQMVIREDKHWDVYRQLAGT
jgi:hypothetical protein